MRRALMLPALLLLAPWRGPSALAAATPAPVEAGTPAPSAPITPPRRLAPADDSLLEAVQRRTFRYFWDFAHPVSGLARERSNVTNYGPEVVTTGGSGF